jgi:predicted metal-dependent HD superfamily phosphohydrolase
LFQPLLDKWEIQHTVAELLDRWKEPHRKYHSVSHLQDLVEQIQHHRNLTTIQQEMLLLTALYHDVIYNPEANNNEEASAEFFLEAINDPLPYHWQIAFMIYDTTHHKPSSPLSALFSEMDMSIVTRPYKDLLEWEHGIQYEYSFLPIDTYIEKRTAFLQQMVFDYPANAHALTQLIVYVQSAKTRPLIL